MNKELDKLKGAIQMCCNMLNRSGRPAQQEAADELKSALGEFCEAARATPAQPVSTKTYQQRADDAGLTVRTKESLFDYAIAEIADLRAICKHDTAEQVDIAKRLRRVAKDAGIPVDGDDNFVYGVAFALLGQIASALESKPSPSSVGAAIRALPLPESQATGDSTTDFHGRLFKYTDEEMRALLNSAAALVESTKK